MKTIDMDDTRLRTMKSIDYIIITNIWKSLVIKANVAKG